VTHPGYGWGEFCERTFGDIPSQICFGWNMPRHTTDDAVPAKKRSFTNSELQRLFDYLDDLVDREYAAGSKRWLPLFRDSVALTELYPSLGRQGGATVAKEGGPELLGAARSLLV
jgi:integrase/recombinase XerD